MASCTGGFSLTVTFQGLIFLCVLAHILEELDVPHECFEVTKSTHPFQLLNPNLPFILDSRSCFHLQSTIPTGLQSAWNGAQGFMRAQQALYSKK